MHVKARKNSVCLAIFSVSRQLKVVEILQREGDVQARTVRFAEAAARYNVQGSEEMFCKSMGVYQQFVIRTIGTLENVVRIQSVFVMDTIKLTYGIKI